MIITKDGEAKYISEIEKMKIDLKKLRENKASAYVLTGDTWHDNPYFKMLEQEEEQLVSRINDIQEVLHNAEIIDTSNRNVEEISVGSIFRYNVVYDDEPDSENGIFEIVGYGETTLEEDCISCESPVAQNLMGHKLNDVVTFDTPGGKASYRILKFYKDWVEARNDHE